jgi:hypothetical protein
MKDGIRTYVLSAWLTSVLISPVVYVLANPIPDGYNASLLVVAVMIVSGVCISIPFAILFDIATRCLARLNLSMMATKAWLSVIGMVLCYSPFWILGDFKFYKGDLYIAVPYGVVLMVAIWIYRINISNSHQVVDDLD